MTAYFVLFSGSYFQSKLRPAALLYVCGCKIWWKYITPFQRYSGKNSFKIMTACRPSGYGNKVTLKHSQGQFLGHNHLCLLYFD